MTHISVSKLMSMGNGILVEDSTINDTIVTVRRQTIIWTTVVLLLIETNISEIWKENNSLKILSAKRWTFCLGLRVLKALASV